MPSNPKPARAQLRPGALKFSSRFLDQPCLTLFDRGGLQRKLKAKTLVALSNLDAAMDWLDERKAALV
jgi:hypothetical protein